MISTQLVFVKKVLCIYSVFLMYILVYIKTMENVAIIKNCI
nr:MAG TPA: hypothetical protein [Caudoviricetes sp.]